MNRAIYNENHSVKRFIRRPDETCTANAPGTNDEINAFEIPCLIQTIPKRQIH
jgi:hypothetical protein